MLCVGQKYIITIYPKSPSTLPSNKAPSAPFPRSHNPAPLGLLLQALVLALHAKPVAQLAVPLQQPVALRTLLLALETLLVALLAALLALAALARAVFRRHGAEPQSGPKAAQRCHDRAGGEHGNPESAPSRKHET